MRHAVLTHRAFLSPPRSVAPSLARPPIHSLTHSLTHPPTLLVGRQVYDRLFIGANIFELKFEPAGFGANPRLCVLILVDCAF